MYTYHHDAIYDVFFVKRIGEKEKCIPLYDVLALIHLRPPYFTSSLSRPVSAREVRRKGTSGTMHGRAQSYAVHAM
jgi:hypothetical protein